jgi:HSP20 family protein
MEGTKTNGTTATSSPAPVKERGLTSRSPFDLFAQMKSEMDRVFGEFMPFSRTTQWAPATDVYTEADGSMVMKVELPGVKREDIHVTIEHGDMVIRGERKSEEKVEDKNFMRMERSYGSFYRRLPLPVGITEKEISASQSEGVLEIRIKQPKGAVESGKRIPIS